MYKRQTLLTPHPATARPPPPGTPHHPLCRGTNVRSIHRYPSLQQGTSSYRLLSASIFLVRAYGHASARRLCFAQMSRVSLSFIIPFSMMRPAGTTSGDSARNRRYGAKGYHSVRLSVGQALPVSRYACPHCCCCCTSAHVGGGPSSTTNERRLSAFFWTRKQADIR